MNRQPFRAIKNTGGMETTSERQPGRRTPTRNNRSGVRKATAKVTGLSSWLLTNVPIAASQYIAPNHKRAVLALATGRITLCRLLVVTATRFRTFSGRRLARFVRHRLAAEIDPDKTPHGQRIHAHPGSRLLAV
jgi:hypothetical protein